MTLISQNMDINKLDDMANESNNKYHRTINIKPTGIKDNAYIGFSKEVNDKYRKFKVGNRVKISR